MQAPLVYIDGTLIADATDANDTDTFKSGGGSGGSIFISCDNLRGQGLLTATGGSATGHGGGGAGGRIGLQYHNSTYTGDLRAQGGGDAYEAGGAGTIILQDILRGENRLLVDNKFVGSPRIVEVGYGGPGRDSCRTWLPSNPDDSDYYFVDVDIRGLAHLAMYKEHSNDKQAMTSERSSGDSTGYFHIGSLQVRMETIILSNYTLFTII